MFRDQIIAAIRTGCAVLGAAIVTWLVNHLPGVDLDPNLSTMLGVALAAVGIAVYNLAVNWATANVWDGFGWLLGVNKAPSYVAPTAEQTGVTPSHGDEGPDA